MPEAPPPPPPPPQEEAPWRAVRWEGGLLLLRVVHLIMMISILMVKKLMDLKKMLSVHPYRLLWGAVRLPLLRSEGDLVLLYPLL